ncbi:MAG TPA: M28 family metallopeptidase [Candidatus Rifleibacterium sp.]|nr:M28 family metallopeptidase [Candidatus Rifleibacterium sp.]HPT46349.1 M28 family metallopeptidase [Candidatus Rifleibacterium sp.]
MKFFARSGFAKFGMAMAFMGCSAAFAADWVQTLPTAEGYALIKKSGSGTEKYTQLGETIIIRGGEIFNDAASKAPQGTSTPVRPGEKLYMVTTKDPAILSATFPGARVVFKGHGFIVLLAGETAGMNIMAKSSDFTRVDLLPENQVVLTTPEMGDKSTFKTNDAIADFIDKLDMPAFMNDLNGLVNFKTRYTYVEPAQQSVNYCQKILEDLGCKVWQAQFNLGGSMANNLIAEIKGSDEARYGQVIMCGHLDSTSRQPSNNAPGADDNGSGAAGAISMARLIKDTGVKPAATIRFVLFMGEEQGLYGSKAYVKSLSTEEKSAIRAVFNLDMIAFDAVAPLSVMIETSSQYKPLVGKLTELAKNYANFSITTSYSPHGSDHAPFLTQKIPAVLTIQSEFDSNPNYHQVTDTMAIVNENLCRNILRMNAAAMYVYGITPEGTR